MAALRGADAKLNSEKLRQLELAKLRREQRKLKNEEKFDTAAILFGMAKMHEAARDARWVAYTETSLKWRCSISSVLPKVNGSSRRSFHDFCRLVESYVI